MVPTKPRMLSSSRGQGSPPGAPVSPAPSPDGNRKRRRPFGQLHGRTATEMETKAPCTGPSTCSVVPSRLGAAVSMAARGACGGGAPGGGRYRFTTSTKPNSPALRFHASKRYPGLKYPHTRSSCRHRRGSPPIPFRKASHHQHRTRTPQPPSPEPTPMYRRRHRLRHLRRRLRFRAHHPATGRTAGRCIRLHTPSFRRYGDPLHEGRFSTDPLWIALPCLFQSQVNGGLRYRPPYRTRCGIRIRGARSCAA